MPSDIQINDSVVIAIQGNAVSDETPIDGYVLTWNDSGDGYWIPRPPLAFGLNNKISFISNDTWICPQGVNTIICVGYGGGSGGGGGACGLPPNNIAIGGAGGAGSLECSRVISVTPGTTYTIIIGSGGAGGTSAPANPSGSSGGPGSSGGNTEFKNGSTTLFFAAGAGAGGGGSNGPGQSFGTGGSANPFDPVLVGITRSYKIFGYGGDGNILSNFPGISGGINSNNTYSPGVGGTTSGANFIGAGSGGGAGIGGPGGNGAPGANTGAGTTGSSASANSGAGGGGGSGSPGGFASGAGGAGGSGYLSIFY